MSEPTLINGALLDRLDDLIVIRGRWLRWTHTAEGKRKMLENGTSIRDYRIKIRAEISAFNEVKALFQQLN